MPESSNQGRPLFGIVGSVVLKPFCFGCCVHVADAVVEKDKRIADASNVCDKHKLPSFLI